MLDERSAGSHVPCDLSAATITRHADGLFTSPGRGLQFSSFQVCTGLYHAGFPKRSTLTLPPASASFSFSIYLSHKNCDDIFPGNVGVSLNLEDYTLHIYRRDYLKQKEAVLSVVPQVLSVSGHNVSRV